MDSINNNQPEDNHQNLSGREAVLKIRELVGKAPNCFFCTTPAPEGGAAPADTTGDSYGARPMNVQQVDDEGNLWFLSASDSHKNRELASDPTVTLYFQGSQHSDFLQLRGEASISTDRAKIEELWEPLIKTWFTAGVDDPRITVIKVVPREGYYWDTKHGNVVAGIKILIGAAIGQTLDDSLEGRLTV